MSYDVIVVGARCAGAPTAMLLARRGYRVLLVDAAELPSDMRLSTHLVHPSGAERLRRWGLLDEVIASGCPPVERFQLDFGPIQLEGPPVPAGDLTSAYAPRRFVLDRILLGAALRAGVEVRTSFTVTDLCEGESGVEGVSGLSNDAVVVTEGARLIVGADGRNSRIAELVGAARYEETAPLQGTYFGYWRGLPLDSMELHLRSGRGVYAFPTNNEMTLVGANWAIADFRAARFDIEQSYREVIADCAPELARRLERGARDGDLVGGAVGAFMRKPFGPGWALVGDAGMTMDPCTAAGINNAFRDVEALVDAIDRGLSGASTINEALGEYHARRDEIGLPIYGLTRDLAAFDPPTAEMAALLGALVDNPEQTSRFIGVLAQTVSPVEFFGPENIGRIMNAARR